MRVFTKRPILAFALLILCLGSTVFAATKYRKAIRHTKRQNAPPSAVYTKQIQPILEKHCYGCHGPTTSKAGLRLDTVAGILKGGESGGIIIRGDGANSLLVTMLIGIEDRMRMPPSGEPLTEKQIGIIKNWIDQGAALPLEPESKPVSITPSHWAFRAVATTSVPTTQDSSEHNPIDAFLATGRGQRGLIPVPPAPRAILLRRLFIDLIGLPPTREQLAAFLADTSEDAYEKVVDHLLATPQYGERWARHWMDVWRYSEADGRKTKAEIWWSDVHLWRWRDWIIRSINQDKGYDRMVLEMLAGDEIAPDDIQTLAATGFLARNTFRLDRNIWLNNTVEHTAKAFLGLSIGCARCHDHKFDPISQKEYYQFRAIFEPHDIRIDPVPGETGPSAKIARSFDARPDEPTLLLIRGDPKTPDKSAHLTPGVPKVLGSLPLLPKPKEGSTSTGRREALAHWIGDRQNPLAARVAVNHIWARHFGRPLVDNVADFGTRTPAPVQQPLLDWMALELMNHQWSMKHLHRLMVNSKAYRMQSTLRNASAGNASADPDNQFYWRANSRRMEAEVVRDSLLWLAGVLDPTEGGPPIDPERGSETGRRSIYYRYSREDRIEFLTAFDPPGVEECYQREQSIVPQQALALENSDFSWDQARRIARSLEVDTPNSSAFVVAAFEHVLCRPPEPAEVSACEGFLANQEALLADHDRLTPLPPTPPVMPIDPKAAKKILGLPLVLGVAEPLPSVAPAGNPVKQAREYLVHALLNHSDFITIR